MTIVPNAESRELRELIDELGPQLATTTDSVSS